MSIFAEFEKVAEKQDEWLDKVKEKRAEEKKAAEKPEEKRTEEKEKEKPFEKVTFEADSEEEVWKKIKEFNWK